MNDKGNLTDKHPPFFPTLIGTSFGVGFWPWGPGTAGSIFGVLVWLVLGMWLPDGISRFSLGACTLYLVVLFTVLGTWAVRRLQPYWGDDPSRVVIDETIGVWIPLIVLPHDAWLWALAALVLFRFFDIVKPLGIKMLDRKCGAFWVIADDILGGIYSLIVLVVVRTIINQLS